MGHLLMFMMQLNVQAKLKLKTQPVLSFADRKSNAEAMLISFGVENSLTFSVQAKILKLAKELARDPKALQSLSLERTTLTYTLKSGLAEVTLLSLTCSCTQIV